jgi:hypothetical protein
LTDIREQRFVLILVKRKPERECRFELFGAHLVSGEPDPLQWYEKLFPVITEIRAGLAFRGWRMFLSQKTDGVLAIISAGCAELAENDRLLLPARFPVTVTDCLQVITTRLKHHITTSFRLPVI